MKHFIHFVGWQLYRVGPAILLVCAARPVPANPVGGSVSQGTASFSSRGPQFTINTSDRAFINWQSFNIGLGETTTFVQPSASSLVWNQIHDANPSQILGNLSANGYVVLQNQSGFYIGGQASISAHGLLLTTAPLPLPDLSSGGPWAFSAPPPTASIINYGQISTERGGSVFLLAHEIDNRGSISAPEGSIGLYAGKEVLISERPDGRGLAAQVTLPEGSVDNSGKLIADAGSIALHAQVVNVGGMVQANSVREVNGAIELVASDAVNLGRGAVISAKGGTQGSSPGGEITIKSAGSYSDQPGSLIDISGGAQGGNGGEVEISAPQMNALQANIQGRASPGYLGGKLLLDPLNIVLSDSGSAAPPAGTVGASDPPATGTLTLDVNTLNNLVTQNGLSQIHLQASQNIELTTLWSLPDSQTPRSALTLIAGNNITLDDGSGIDAGRNWSVNLFAGPQSPATRPAAHTWGIYLNGNSFVETLDGDINLWAANEILVATGSSSVVMNNGIRTLDGGNINVTTLYGNVNAGGNPLGYQYQPDSPYYSVSTDASLGQALGGISTAAGGNVMIKSGQDVFSFLPVNTTGQLAAGDGGSGAFGPEPGNVSITAAGSVYGHYVVANGQGVITAGQNAGGAVASRNLALSLIKGGWTVNALSGNIYLQEVRNPNGIFNNTGDLQSTSRHFFDYDPSASVSLNAPIGGVYLTCLSLPRPSDPIPAIFPPLLSISAGLGGVFLQDKVTLFPSSAQGLNIATTGNFEGMPNQPFTQPALMMSDSARKQWLVAGSFGANDHGPMPLGLNSTDPVLVDVTGNMEKVTLVTTKATTIKVGGDMNNCGFSGQNLHGGDTTSILVAGRIYNRSPYSFVILDQGIPSVPPADLPFGLGVTWDFVFNLLLDPAKAASLKVPTNVDPTQWATYVATSASLFPPSKTSANPGFVYDPATRRLGFSGQMSPSVLAALTQPLAVLRFNADGTPATYLGTDGNRYFATDPISFLPPSAIQALYAASQGAPSPANYQLGYRIGGPGTFDVQADSISLGNSIGILSCGVHDPQGGFGRYANLASLTDSGATLNVDVVHNLDMLTSTIASLAGGDVNVSSSLGSMDLGSQELFNTRRQLGFGIYSSGRGNVNVVALGDINIDGSRIASYNGGDIYVKSLDGNVNAGTGGTAYIGVEVSYVDPVTGVAKYYGEQVFGSGIVANTLVNPAQVPGAANLPGNITVETPHGNIFASQGGILQEALNGNVSAGPTITLAAGTMSSGTPGSPDYVPGYVGNIDLGQSGVIGGSVRATANGNITGLVISRQNSDINAAQSFSGTVLSGGTANLSAGGTISGTVVGIGGINASGGQGVSAALISQNVSVGGAQAQSTLGTSATATTTSQSAAQQANNDAQQQVASNTATEDDDKKKKGKEAPTLVRRVGRVTVLLPPAS